MAPSIYKEIRYKRIGAGVMMAQWIRALLCKHGNLSPAGHYLYTSEPGTPAQVLSVHTPVSLAKPMNFSSVIFHLMWIRQRLIKEADILLWPLHELALAHSHLYHIRPQHTLIYTSKWY